MKSLHKISYLSILFKCYNNYYISLVSVILTGLLHNNYCSAQLGYKISIMSSSLTLQNDCKCFGISDDNIQLAQLKQYINYYQYNQEGSGRIRVGTRTNNTRSSNPLFDFTTVGGQVLKLNRKEVINSEWYHFNRNLPFSRSEIRSLVFIIGSDITFVCGPRITGSLFPLECSECGNGNNAYEVSVGSRFIWKYIEGLKANEVAAIPIELAYKPAGKPNFNDGKLSVNFLYRLLALIYLNIVKQPRP